jgi:hypothetical protein
MDAAEQGGRKGQQRAEGRAEGGQGGHGVGQGSAPDEERQWWDENRKGRQQKCDLVNTPTCSRLLNLQKFHQSRSETAKSSDSLQNTELHRHQTLQ